MSAIKDVIDLTVKLVDRVKDRKLAEEIRQIQSLISLVQSENAVIVSANLELEKKVFELEKVISNLEQSQSKEVSQMKEKYSFVKECGIYQLKDGKSNHYFCASCLLHGIESPLLENSSGWKCQSKECDKFYMNPEWTPPQINYDYDPIP